MFNDISDGSELGDYTAIVKLWYSSAASVPWTLTATVDGEVAWVEQGVFEDFSFGFGYGYDDDIIYDDDYGTESYDFNSFDWDDDDYGTESSYGFNSFGSDYDDDYGTQSEDHVNSFGSNSDRRQRHLLSSSNDVSPYGFDLRVSKGFIVTLDSYTRLDC